MDSDETKILKLKAEVYDALQNANSLNNVLAVIAKKLGNVNTVDDILAKIDHLIENQIEPIN